MPDPLQTVAQQVALAKAKMAQEYPDQAGASIEPMGAIGRFFAGPSYARTNPFTGNVSLNEPAMQGLSQNEVDQILAHELTHTRQAQAMPLSQKLMLPINGLMNSLGDLTGGKIGTPYAQRPEEMEAFGTEADRANAQHLDIPGDIWLPPDPAVQALKKQAPTPPIQVNQPGASTNQGGN